MSSRYSACCRRSARRTSRSRSTSREADDRVQRRPQLVRHVGQELGLVAARGLELAVEPPELVVHPVDVRRRARRARRGSATSTWPEKSPEAIAASRVSDPLDRADQRPREDESRAASARKTLPAATPMKRFRELVVRARGSLRSASFVLSVVDLGQRPGGDFEIDGQRSRRARATGKHCALEPAILPTSAFSSA